MNAHAVAAETARTVAARRSHGRNTKKSQSAFSSRLTHQAALGRANAGPVSNWIAQLFHRYGQTRSRSLGQSLAPAPRHSTTTQPPARRRLCTPSKNPGGTVTCNRCSISAMRSSVRASHRPATRSRHTCRRHPAVRAFPSRWWPAPRSTTTRGARGRNGTARFSC